MKNKPIIGIIGRNFSEENNSIIKVNEDYRLAIIKSGGIPFIIIPVDEFKYDETLSYDAAKLTSLAKEDLLTILEMCDGIVMTGGTHWYQHDEIICKYALDNNIPILGICLGMQIMGNLDNFCGTIDSDKTVKNDTSINHFMPQKSYVHECIIEKGILYEILNVDRLKVNSRHNCHIVSKDYFKIEAYSEDGLIEAISIPNHKFALGIQWHPESMLEYDIYMQKIFHKFIKIAKKDKKK